MGIRRKRTPKQNTKPRTKRSGASGYRKTLFRDGFFVAWDGEGVTKTGGDAARAILADYPGDLSWYNTALDVSPARVMQNWQPGDNPFYARIFTLDESGAPAFDAAAIASEAADVLWRALVLGKGVITDSVLAEFQTRAARVLAADVWADAASLTAAERSLLTRLADRSGTTARDTLDELRDKRLRGRLAPRRAPRRSYRTDGYVSAAGSDAIERLREIRRAAGKRPARRAPLDLHQLALSDSGTSASDPPDDAPGAMYHVYTSIAAAWRSPDSGEWLYRVLRSADRLTTTAITEFLYSVAAETGKYAIHVGYYLSYDFTHILHDLDPQNASYAIVSMGKRWGRHGKDEYKLKTRKELKARRREWTGEYDEAGKRIYKTLGYIRLWDVSGFFQSSFTRAVEAWLGHDYPDLPMLKTGKAARADFAAWDTAAVDAYNRAELKALVLVMDRVRASIARAGYSLSRWDGAGALASSFYQKHMPAKVGGKSWFERAALPEPVERAAQYAYFGGRIEYIQYGTYSGYIWQGDINSAYPAAMATVPDLTAGAWRYNAAPDAVSDFALYHVRWQHCNRAGIGPFPFRLDSGHVLFPADGESWVWGVELAAARQLYPAGWGAAVIEVLEGWEYEDTGGRPFAWIAELYKRRQALVTQAKAGDTGADGEQKILKLGLNSLYGKTVQKIGYTASHLETVYRYVGTVERVNESTETRYPPYYNLAVGGYITAHCRAQLLRAAASNPAAVIAFATDGVYATAPLIVDAPAEKILGKWEVVEYPAARFVQVQPGVYYIHTGQKWVEKCRGFSPAALSWMNDDEKQAAIAARVDAITRGFASIKRLKTRAVVAIPEQRFITLKSALATDYSKRGQWVTAPRELRLYNASSKRANVGSYKSPARHLVRTAPRSTTGLYWESGVMSKPYDGLPPRGTAPGDEEIENEAIWLDALERGIIIC